MIYCRQFLKICNWALPLGSNRAGWSVFCLFWNILDPLSLWMITIKYDKNPDASFPQDDRNVNYPIVPLPQTTIPHMSQIGSPLDFP